MRKIPGLRSLRGRLVALLLLGAIPLAAMAGLVAWQNYRSAVARAERSVLLLEQAASARHEAAIEEVGQELAAAAASPGMFADPARCGRQLDNLLALRGGRYIGLEVVDAEGQVRCQALPAGAPATPFAEAESSVWFRLVRQSRAFTVVAARHPGGGILMQAAYPLVRTQHFLGAVVALLPVDWFSRLASDDAAPYAIWLIDPEGRLIPAPGSAPEALPPVPRLRRLLATAPVLATEPSASGRPYFYALSDLGGGLRLLVAQDASGSVAAAREVLIDRLLGLGLLIVLGMAAALLGANLALVQPIERLTGAVERWRVGVRFDPARLEDVPLDLEGLCRAFGQATEALDKREDQLRDALAKQELLAQEIHHRVKNNLQVVASLLNLQASRIRQPEARAEFQSARDRVRALATLHRHLYLQGEMQAINMRGFLTELCGQLLHALSPGAAERIRLEIEAPDLLIASDQAVPLALIVTETVGNAIKYAFPGGRAGHISVRLTAEDGQAKLVVQDDGIGLPAGRSETETGVRDGIGLQLVRGLARQLGATLAVSEAEGEGTRYEITMRLSPVNSAPPTPEIAAPAEAVG